MTRPDSATGGRDVYAGDRLFCVERDDGPGARDPYLTIVEYLVEHTTRTQIVVRTVRRGGVDVRHSTRQRWGRNRLIYHSESSALRAYADQQEREALARRHEAERAERRAAWALEALRAREGAEP